MKKKLIVMVCCTVILSILISLCGFKAYQDGLLDSWLQKESVSPTETVQSAAENEDGVFDSWLQKESVSPEETVRSAIENEIEKEYTLYVKVGEITVSEQATERFIKMYQGSDLAKSNGWSDDYLKNNLIVVRAQYYIEYDHEKIFFDDGEMDQYFILLKNETTQLWHIFDNTTSGEPSISF